MGHVLHGARRLPSCVRGREPPPGAVSALAAFLLTPADEPAELRLYALGMQDRLTGAVFSRWGTRTDFGINAGRNRGNIGKDRFAEGFPERMKPAFFAQTASKS